MPSILLLQRDHEASPRLAALIESSEKFSVLGVVHTVADARERLGSQQPDVLVTDLRVQDGEAGPLLDDLRRIAGLRRPHVLVTMLSGDDSALMEALRGGADAYWLHTSPPELLIETLAGLCRGESRITPSIARTMLSFFDARPTPRFDNATEAFDALVLTDFEREVLQWLARGFLIDEIARQWHTGTQQVGEGIRQAVTKLQFTRRASHLSLSD
jgi:DNA-binding NarL/FixJ family response regulator